MTARELFEIAIGVEEDGERFYTELARRSKDQLTREFFEFMAGEERKHAERFREIADRYASEEVYVDSDETLAYLRDVSSGRIFPRYDDMLAWIEGKGFEQVIDYSINMEKETIIFYLEMSALVGDEARKMLEEIVDEERGHIKLLMKIKREGLS